VLLSTLNLFVVPLNAQDVIRPFRAAIRYGAGDLFISPFDREARAFRNLTQRTPRKATEGTEGPMEKKKMSTGRKEKG
jgi:hypothetical protein